MNNHGSAARPLSESYTAKALYTVMGKIWRTFMLLNVVRTHTNSLQVVDSTSPRWDRVECTVYYIKSGHWQKVEFIKQNFSKVTRTRPFQLALPETLKSDSLELERLCPDLPYMYKIQFALAIVDSAQLFTVQTAGKSRLAGGKQLKEICS